MVCVSVQAQAAVRHYRQRSKAQPEPTGLRQSHTAADFLWIYTMAMILPISA